MACSRAQDFAYSEDVTAAMIPEKFTFGEFVRKMREDRDWTQQQLIERSEISPGTISALENDETNPKRDTMERLAKAFNMTRGELEMAFETYIRPASVPPDNVVQMPLRRAEDFGLDPSVLELARRVKALPPIARHAVETTVLAFEESDRGQPEK
jgi:transcriptional regulator with XRE-family HTH domain